MQRQVLAVAFLLALAIVTALAASQGGDPTGASDRLIRSRDLRRLASVGDVQLAPDGSRVIYSVTANAESGWPRSPSRLLNLRAAGGEAASRATEAATDIPLTNARWSPDGRKVAGFVPAGDGQALSVLDADGRSTIVHASVAGTNHPLPSAGERLAWAPDSRRLAFLGATPGPETGDATGDPVVITRYLYKPTASEGLTRFDDNRRLHIFLADISARDVRQLTSGVFYEHSIAWSPRGDEIAFVSNREPDPDRTFNYDIFAVRVSDGSIRRLTATPSAEYEPAWSPDGRLLAFLATKRPLTSSETTMEDTHVWVMNADGSNRRELGAAIDNRQDSIAWSPEGDAIYTSVEEAGSVRIYRLPLDAGPPRLVAPAPGQAGTVGRWSVGRGGALAYAMVTPQRPAELYVARNGDARAVTALNDGALAGKAIAGVERFTFRNEGQVVEAFLTTPVDRTAPSRHPLVVMIHGGPHGQQGPAFNFKAQAYAAHGYAVLMVNYRGSTGYGQHFADAISKDQDGAEARDVLAGVDAAIARYRWIDPDRLGIEGGSYGGQLTNWLITRTNRFKAAIPIAGISNLVSFNYMAYYHDYLAVEFGMFPHERWSAACRPDDPLGYRSLMDFLWERSPLRYARNVRTPTLLVHGENDNDVPVAEAEQFYIALKDAGVETRMVRYPREGHGVRETGHVIDLIDRSLAWYDAHFGKK